jgi:hypothetical protein
MCQADCVSDCAESYTAEVYRGHDLYCLQKEMEEKARQPETKLGAIAHTRREARLRNAKQSRTKNHKLHTRGKKQALTTSVAGRERPRIGVSFIQRRASACWSSADQTSLNQNADAQKQNSPCLKLINTDVSTRMFDSRFTIALK